MSLTKVRFLCLSKLAIFFISNRSLGMTRLQTLKLLIFTLTSLRNSLKSTYCYRTISENWRRNIWWWVGEVPSSSTQSATHYIVSLENFCFFGCQVRTFRSCKNSCNLTRSNDVYQMFHLEKWKVPHKWVFRLLWLLVASPAN